MIVTNYFNSINLIRYHNLQPRTKRGQLLDNVQNTFWLNDNYCLKICFFLTNHYSLKSYNFCLLRYRFHY